MKKISVITLTYNHEKYIAQCLQSVISQELELDFEMEILIGDDASTDSTVNIASEFSKKSAIPIKIFNQKNNVGVSDNFSNLMTKVTGEFIVFLDGDDYMLPGKLKNQLNIFKKDKNITVVHHNVLDVDENSHVIRSHRLKSGVKGGVKDFLKNCQGNMQSCAVMVRNPNIDNWKEIIPTSSRIVDLPFILHSIKSGRIAYINEVFSAYRTHSSSITRSTKILDFEENTRLHINQAVDFNNLSKMYINTSLSASFLRCAIFEFGESNYISFYRYVMSALSMFSYPSYWLIRTYLKLFKVVCGKLVFCRSKK
jgi:glycosyltransferase involved in cell wall biosynthesis